MAKAIIKNLQKMRGKKKMKKFNLNPSASVRQKSFYGKAKVMHDEETGIVQLKSYDTIVCMIDNFGKFHKLWNGYSATTMKHVQSFCDYYGIENGGEKWWDSLPCCNSEKYRIEIGNGFYNRKISTVFDNYEDAEEYAGKITARNPFLYYQIEEVA